MNGLSEFLLTSMQTYGAWVLGAATLISALGMPLPATMLLVAAGAFAQQGLLDWQTAIVLAALGAVLGDQVSYWMGWSGSALTLRRVRATPAWQHAQGLFQRWGGLAIFLSRFALTPLALPVNLLAGSTRYGAWRFFGPAALGEILWVLIFGGLGFAFADQWANVSALTNDLSTYFLVLMALLLGSAYWLRRQRLKPAVAAV
ncbi:MAG: DedA family protein [Anaerolineales bacterium]